MAGPWAGVDVGGPRKGFHVAVVDEVGLIAEPIARPTVDQAVAYLARLQPALVAVDSPCAPAPAGERYRGCERELARRVCGIRWTPDAQRLTANPSYYGWVLHGLELYRGLRTAGLAAVECFPTASWTRWVGRRGARRRAVWTAAGLATLPLAGLPERTNQDIRDAIAAALTARQCAEGNVEWFGELAVPLAPSLARGYG